MQKLDAYRCKVCARVKIKTSENGCSRACSMSLDLLRQTYEVEVVEFTCRDCMEAEILQHEVDRTANNAGSVH